MPKKPCDILLAAAVAVTQDEERRVVEDAAVAVRAGTIEAVGPRGTVEAAFAPAEVLDMPRGLVMPGLINAHTHASMTIFRGVADDLPLMEWLTRHIWPAEKDLTPEIVEIGALLACAEMIRTGTTCFCDMYLLERHVARAVDASGMRGVLGEGLFCFPSPAYSDIERGFELAEELHAGHAGHPRIRTAVVPHAVYTTTPEILARSYDMAERHDAVWKIHLAETASETRECLEKFGQRPVAYLDGLGVLGERSLLAHGVDLTDAEIARLAAAGAHVAHNPESNMKLGSGVARTVDLLRAGVGVALGTDGAASNNDLNMFKEMASAALLQKAVSHDPTALTAGQALDMATRGGAAALRWPQLGSLAPGQAADLVVLDLDSPNLVPIYHPVSHLVYAASGHEVCLTMVAGKVLYRHGGFTGIDYPALLSEVESVRKWVLRRVAG